VEHILDHRLEELTKSLRGEDYEYALNPLGERGSKEGWCAY
jgi:hypothetical protein